MSASLIFILKNMLFFNGRNNDKMLVHLCNPEYCINYNLCSSHNSWANTGKLRSDCWPTVGNFRFANRAPTKYLPTMASGWASAKLSLVYQPTIPQHWSNKIIFYWSNSVLKLMSLRLFITGIPTHHFPTVSTIY